MDLDILLVSYNRPDCVSGLVSSLSKQNAGDYRVRAVHLMQDGPNPLRVEDDQEKIDQCIDVFRNHFPEGRVHAPKQNVGIVGNYSAVVNHMAATTADAVIVIEDDLELSPHYLNVMVQLLRYAETSRQVGMVSAKGLLGATQAMQQERSRALIPMGSTWGVHRWGWGIVRETMAEYVPILKMYLDYATRLGFSDNGDQERRARMYPHVARFINAMGFRQKSDGIEIDCIYDLAAVVLGRVNLCTYANFIRSVGARGIHYNDRLFEEISLNKSVFFNGPPPDFAWYEPGMMLDILTLIRRFHASLHLNYNSGTFACSPPFKNLEIADLIRFLYEDIFGWPLTMADLKAHKFHSRVELGEFWNKEAIGILRTTIPIKQSYPVPYAIERTGSI